MGNSCSVPARRSCGFTLLELIIVITLIGLFMVVSVPALRDRLIGDPLGSAGRKMIGYIGEVRDKAVREQQSYLLYVDLDENRLWYLKESEVGSITAEPPEQEVLQLGPNVELRDIWMKATGTVSRGVPELWVSRQGYLDETIIHLEIEDGETLSLLVGTFIPGIEVREGYYEPE